MDTTGNVFVADSGNHTIRQISPDGNVTTLAGSPGEAGSTDAAGAEARFREPKGIAVDRSGNIYVADKGNLTIRKVSPGGAVTTIAGSPGAFGSVDGPGSEARFREPVDVAVDLTGNIYIVDKVDHTIRKASPSGIVSTLAGSSFRTGSDDGVGTEARFLFPAGLAVDQAGNLFVGDGNNTIRMVTADGKVTTLAGSTTEVGSTDGNGGAARFQDPRGVAVTVAGIVFVADKGNHSIRRVTQAGAVSSLAGSPAEPGDADGFGTAARFRQPLGIAIHKSGNVYVADRNNHTIRRVNPSGVVTTIAGTPGESGSTDGAGGDAKFNTPWAVAVDEFENVYVADGLNYTIRKVSPEGVVSTLAGSARQQGSADGAGSDARFDHPWGVAVDGSGFLYVADAWNNTIRKVSPNGEVTTLAGSPGQAGSADGDGSDARFRLPEGLTVDDAGNVYVADKGNHTIRKVSPSGSVSTLAGDPNQLGSVDGVGNSALFYAPRDVDVDDAGNIYVVDSGRGERAPGDTGHTVRKITSAGVVTTIGGNRKRFGQRDGVGQVALFYEPVGVAISKNGQIFVTELKPNRIRVGTPVTSRVLNAPSTLATESTDTDGDGVGDFDELMAGTDPENPASVMTVLSANVIRENGTSVEVRFPVVSGRIYGVEYSPDMAAGSWVVVADLLTPKSGASVLTAQFEVPDGDVNSGYVRVAVHVGDADDSAYSPSFALNGERLGPRLISAQWSESRGSFELSWQGERGAPYHLERSEDLSSWQKVEGSEVEGTGAVQASFLLPEGISFYYRVAESK